MAPRLRKWLNTIADTFWVVPALLALFGAIGAICLIRVEKSGNLPQWLLQDWLYDGGATGARTLLGAIASSTIGVAGTVFSITIAALSLAAGQMGPRLLRNFIRDRGNQVTLGVFIGTFCYALMALRSVRTEAEGGFVPHLSLSVAIALAFVCVATLVYFVGHMAGRINVDTVIQLVSDDLQNAIVRLTSDAPQQTPPPPAFWQDAALIRDARSGYLQELDEQGLATWAAEHATTLQLLVRPGDYVFPGAPIALMKPQVDGADGAVRNATALGQQRVSSSDLRFAIRQLVEVAARALSPGVNDPHTAVSVIDRLGVALCELVPLHLPTGVSQRDGKVALVVNHVQYGQLLNTMFHMIRQNAAGNALVLMRQLEVLTQVLSCERAIDRKLALKRHADLVLQDAERTLGNPNDLEDLRRRHRSLEIVFKNGPLGPFAPAKR